MKDLGQMPMLEPFSSGSANERMCRRLMADDINTANATAAFPLRTREERF